jgi:hypothetical protein
MKQDPNTFHFDLSLAELSWLAGAFGIISLPLPLDALQDMTRPQLVEDQKKGHASLLTRGLIRPSPGFGWQVDRLPAAIVQWMTSANSILRVEYIEKKGTKNTIHIFTSGDQALSVEMNGDTANFILYKTHAALKKSLQTRLKIPIKSQKSKEMFSIPQPQILIPVMWKDPNIAAQILENAGLATTSKALIAWAASQNWMGVVSKMQINDETIIVSDPLIICAAEKSLWSCTNNTQEITDSTAMFFTLNWKELDAKMGEML